MLFLAAFATLLAGAGAVGSTSCKGSPECHKNDAQLYDVLQQVKALQAENDGRRGQLHVDPGVQLACAKKNYKSICAKYKSGTGGSIDRAVELLQEMFNNGCRECGIIPIAPGKQKYAGEFTVNVEAVPCCQGTCHCPLK